jgi:hypothetical protein
MKQFTRTFIDDDGVNHVWKYDLDKSTSGPIEVLISYPKGYLETTENIKNNKIDQKYLNPANGKYVSYQRARILGLC